MDNLKEIKPEFAKLVVAIAANHPQQALKMIMDLINENKQLKQKLQDLHETLIRREY